MDLAASFAGLNHSGAVHVIEDVTQDERFATHPCVMVHRDIHFYAEAPLALEPGMPAGAICLMDRSVRAFSSEQREQLENLAQMASTHLKTQQQLRMASEQEALFRLLADNSTDTIVRGNLSGVRLYISPAVRELLGYEPHELIGRRASEIVHPDDAEVFRHLMNDVREGRIDFALSEQRQRHKDGSWAGWRPRSS